MLGLFNNTTQPQWINDTSIVFFSLAFMEWWWGLGYHTMFFLAGLATIPKDLFDSARVDGASEWRMFWGVTFWRLLPIILVLSIIRFGTAMAVIEDIGNSDEAVDAADLFLHALNPQHVPDAGMCLHDLQFNPALRQLRLQRDKHSRAGHVDDGRRG